MVMLRARNAPFLRRPNRWKCLICRLCQNHPQTKRISLESIYKPFSLRNMSDVKPLSFVLLWENIHESKTVKKYLFFSSFEELLWKEKWCLRAKTTIQKATWRRWMAWLCPSCFQCFPLASLVSLSVEKFKIRSPQLCWNYGYIQNVEKWLLQSWAVNLKMGPGDLLDLQVIFRLPRSLSLEKMAALEDSIALDPAEIPIPQPHHTLTPNLCEFPNVEFGYPNSEITPLSLCFFTMPVSLH